MSLETTFYALAGVVLYIGVVVLVCAMLGRVGEDDEPPRKPNPHREG